MSSQAHLQSILQKAAVGERRPLTELLRLLAKTPLFAPVVRMQVVGGSTGTSKIVLRTISDANQKFVPAYLSEEDLKSYAGQNTESFSVLGADLALSLPAGTGLWISRGAEANVKLLPRELRRISEFEDEPEIAEVNEASELVDDARDALRSMCDKYSEIEEAYYVPGKDPTAGGVFGLRAAELSPDRRFRLVASVADVSKRLFGLAGAIEVYDDLSKVSSGSVTMFDTHVPFFVREE